MNIPISMKAELQAWNNGQAIDLESWIGCSGNFSLAVGYTTVFLPKFLKFEDYIFRSDEPVCSEFEKDVRGFESQKNSTPFSVEWIINHIHIADIHYRDCEDISSDKLLIIGNALKEIYEAGLAFLFPESPCIVKFYIPEDPEDYIEYQLSFWQKKHDPKSV